jgi:hypothetical protein
VGQSARLQHRGAGQAVVEIRLSAVPGVNDKGCLEGGAGFSKPGRAWGGEVALAVGAGLAKGANDPAAALVGVAIGYHRGGFDPATCAAARWMRGGFPPLTRPVTKSVAYRAYTYVDCGAKRSATPLWLASA